MIKYTQDNEPYYDQLPKEFRVASIVDFYIEDKLIIEKPYLIHSHKYPSRYWAKRTKEGFMDHNDFWMFLDQNRIFVLINS